MTGNLPIKSERISLSGHFCASLHVGHARRSRPWLNCRNTSGSKELVQFNFSKYTIQNIVKMDQCVMVCYDAIAYQQFHSALICFPHQKLHVVQFDCFWELSAQACLQYLKKVYTQYDIIRNAAIRNNKSSKKLGWSILMRAFLMIPYWV